MSIEILKIKRYPICNNGIYSIAHYSALSKNTDVTFLIGDMVVSTEMRLPIEIGYNEIIEIFKSNLKFTLNQHDNKAIYSQKDRGEVAK